MKKHIMYYSFCITVLCVCVAVLLGGCSQKPDNALPTESTQTEATGPGEFSFVVVGKTTYYDVYKVMPNQHARRGRAEGLLVEYQKEDGGYIHITFREETGIVCAISEVSESVNVTDPVKAVYTMEDFKSVVVGESTFDDVSKVAHIESALATSYGSLCELPLDDGRYIHIGFSYEDVVRSIEVVEESVFCDVIPIEPDSLMP